MIRRFRLWFKRNKGCSKCCLTCKYFEECSYDLLK